MKTYEEREAELREQEVADRETRAVTLESLGRILELERRVDVLSRVVMEMRTDQAAKAAAESGLDFYELQYEMERERQRVKQDSDDLAYQESTRRLRWAAAKFINPRGRFHDLRPEINEILRRHYPATEARLSCLPAPPPSVSPAAETSSGGEKCTAGGVKQHAWSAFAGTIHQTREFVRKHRLEAERSTAGGACEPRRRFLEVFGNLRHAGEGVEGIGPFTHCPWCGTKLDKET